MNLGGFIRLSSSIVVLETVLLSCLMFGTFSVLVRVTDIETVGLWVLVSSLLSFSRAADFWSSGLSSFVGEARGKGQAEEAAAFVATAVMTGAAGYAIFAAVGAGAIWLLAPQLAGPHHAALVREIIPLMAVTFWLLSVGAIYQTGFLGFGRPALKALQTVGASAIFLIAVLVLAPDYGLAGVIAAQAIQGLVSLSFAIIAFHGLFTRSFKLRWRGDQFWRLAAFGSKALTVGTLQLAIEPVIRLLASQFGGLGAVTATEVAARSIAAVRGGITALGQILVPEFARLGIAAKSELSASYANANRLFLLTGLSAFSLLLSAAPAIEELVLGKAGTGFIPFLWFLSFGWLANTITAPTHFLLLGRRRLRPLFWSHLIMTGGAVVFGVGGGLAFGASGAIAGAAAAIIASSIYLVRAAGGAERTLTLMTLKKDSTRALPLLVAIGAVATLQASELLTGGMLMRFTGYATAIAVTFLACILFGDVRGILHTASRLR